MTTLFDIAGSQGIQTGPFGSQLHAKDYEAQGVGVVMPQDLGDNLIDPTRIARISPTRAALLKRHELVPGDIVYSRRGDVTRRALVRQQDGPLICGTGCLRVRLDRDRVDPGYVSYALGTNSAREWITRHAVGATMANLNTTILGALPLTLPPLDTQRAVAQVLGALDNKIAANRQVLNAGLDHLDSTYTASPKTRGPKVFNEVAILGGGGTPSTKDASLWGGSLRWATPTDVTGLAGPWLLDTTRHLSQAGLDRITSGLYPRRTIFMSSRASIGHCALAARPTAVNQGFIAVQAKDDHLQGWLFAQLRHRTAEFVAWANGATFLELSKGVFQSLPVDLAPDHELRSFQEITDPLLDRLEAAQHESHLLTVTRDELLPLLMNGKITVKDAEKCVEQEV